MQCYNKGTGTLEAVPVERLCARPTLPAAPVGCTGRLAGLGAAPLTELARTVLGLTSGFQVISNPQKVWSSRKGGPKPNVVRNKA